jgi:DNA invertase Pin-like site-specific DNA recombinase
MKKSKIDPVYNADVYLRLSKEDGDIVDSKIKSESDSIVNQKELINEFLKNHPEIHIHKYRVDDGFTGVNFERPAFNEMMQAIKEGKVNCVIVKDLSRFGRDYIEVGRYIEKIFPFLGIRFIAINDCYDSVQSDSQSTNILIPFKNFINDAYCRDISIKVRSQLDIKRKNGKFIGAFAPYGYQKSEINKNQLVVDEYAAGIIRDIFRNFIKGYSANKIADYLNDLGVLTPMDYKNETGSQYYTSFKTSTKSTWKHVTVLRILQNEGYTGAIIQGKYTSPNHKIKKRNLQPQTLWVKVPNMHPAIIPYEEFEIVQKLLQIDMKRSPQEQTLSAFSGLLKCGDCGGNMVIKTTTYKNKKYQYYVCGENKFHKNCSPHSISVQKLNDCVLQMLNCYLSQIVSLEKMLHYISKQNKQRPIEKRKQEMLAIKQREIDKYNHLWMSLYEDLQEGLIDEDEYTELKDLYQKRAELAMVEKERIAMQMSLPQTNTDHLSWINVLKKYGKINTMTREVAVTLIDQVLIYSKERIKIQFNFEQLYEEWKDYAENLVGRDAESNEGEQVI